MTEKKSTSKKPTVASPKKAKAPTAKKEETPKKEIKKELYICKQCKSILERLGKEDSILCTNCGHTTLVFDMKKYKE